MPPDTTAAVENAYGVFARYDLGGGVNVCRCNVCVDAEIERQLNTVPLREISSRLLAQYTSSAHGWDGKTENDLRYYLPRYFELIASDDTPSDFDEEHCLVRLGEAGYRGNWKSLEADAVDRFLVALLRERLALPLDIDAMGWAGSGCDPVETTLCTAANAGCDLAFLIATWDSDRARNSTLHLANVIASADWQARQLRDNWWIGHRGPYPEQAMQRVIRWLLRQETRERLEAACLTEQDEGAAILLSHAESIVAGLI